METKDIKLWKVITHDRKSCFISQLNYEYTSGMGDFVITYPVDKWVRPPKGSKIFAFDDEGCAYRWLYYNFRPRWAKNCHIVPAIGRYPYLIKTIVGDNLNATNFSSFWVKPDAHFCNDYYDDYICPPMGTVCVPMGTVCVSMLKCLE